MFLSCSWSESRAGDPVVGHSVVIIEISESSALVLGFGSDEAGTLLNFPRVIRGRLIEGILKTKLPFETEVSLYNQLISHL